MAHGDAREGKWRGNWRMEWVASTLTRPLNMVYPALLTLMRTPRLPAIDWIDAPKDLNGHVRLGERRNVVSARVPSGSARAVPTVAWNIGKKLTDFCILRYKQTGQSGKVIWKPTRCNSNSFIDLQDQLNMFLANFCPSSGAHIPYYLTYIDDARSNTNQGQSALLRISHDHLSICLYLFQNKF